MTNLSDSFEKALQGLCHAAEDGETWMYAANEVRAAHAREVAAARLAGGTETVGQIARWIVERKDGSTTSGRRNAFAKLLRYLSQVKSGISARAGGGKEKA